MPNRDGRWMEACCYCRERTEGGSAPRRRPGLIWFQVAGCEARNKSHFLMPLCFHGNSRKWSSELDSACLWECGKCGRVSADNKSGISLRTLFHFISMTAPTSRIMETYDWHDTSFFLKVATRLKVVHKTRIHHQQDKSRPILTYECKFCNLLID